MIGDAPDSINYVSIATKTEGYSLQDLLDLTNRALHKATIRMANETEAEVCITVQLLNTTLTPDKIHLQMIDFELAQNGYTPLSLRDVKLQKSDVEWADIGGESI